MKTRTISEMRRKDETKLLISRVIPMFFIKSYIIDDGYSPHYGERGRTSWWQWRGRQFGVRHRLLAARRYEQENP